MDNNIVTPLGQNDAQCEVIGISFRGSGKVYYFDSNSIKVKTGMNVIAETARGLEYGKVNMPNFMIAKTQLVLPLKKVIRISTPDDDAKFADNIEKEKQAFSIALTKIQERSLDMKLIDAEYTFDNSKLLFYFTSDDRVDFRELVKDLAGIFHTRIELRQIGIRDEAKIMGGIGVCGREFCCSSFLPDFTQVSIKMAKEQGLSLNSTKISGVCGRLMCCLRFESDVYQEELSKTPKVDSIVITPDGVGKVVSSSPLAGLVKVVLDSDPDGSPKVYDRSYLKPKSKNSAHNGDDSNQNNKSDNSKKTAR